MQKTAKNNLISYDEFLLYEISEKGNNEGMKTGNNKISYGDVYIFFFGYLMGAGEITDCRREAKHD